MGLDADQPCARTGATAGRLGDGTPCHAPVGRMVGDGDRAWCHLGGRRLRPAAGRLRVRQPSGSTLRRLVTADGRRRFAVA